MTLQQKISALQPGQQIQISRTESGYCTVERSADGKTLRFIRYQAGGWTVFKTGSF